MQSSPAAERNKDPILAVLAEALPAGGLVLEVASGTGQHVAHFARALPDRVWQPTEVEPALREVIDARVREAGLTNVLPAIALDASAQRWPVDAADAVVCINMVHISPWAATLGLLCGAARLLGKGGLLFLYGPYRRDGRHTSPGNRQFDADLRARDPAWGIRDTRDVVAAAAAAGFALDRLVEMPANNLSLFFRRTAAGAPGPTDPDPRSQPLR